MRFIDYERELNPEQLEAVEHELGPALVIAGAGSGKTRILVYRLARLMEKGIAPENILLLTFTRKAASTMLERAKGLGGCDVGGVVGGTFHAFAYSMLRRYASHTPYRNGISVMDRADTQSLITMLLKEIFPSLPKGFPRPQALASLFGKVKSLGQSPEEALERFYPHLSRFHGEILSLMERYDGYKVSQGLADYDDLLIQWRDLLARDREVSGQVADRFQFVMVDEYQDTNAVQADMISFMCSAHGNVMAVGDDAQSIYSFRGADFRNIVDFPRLFPGAKVITLVRNYRSTQPILDCTNAIIACAREKFSKELLAQRKGGRPPIVYFASDEEDQAEFVTARIADALGAGFRPEDIAVLFRASFHSFRLESCLQRAGIAFVKRGGMRLLEAAHVKDLLSFLRLLANPWDKLSWHRLLTLLEGVGAKTASRISDQVCAGDDPLGALAEYPSKARWSASARELGSALDRAAGSASLAASFDGALAWYHPFLVDRFPLDHPRRRQELDQLAAMAGRYRSLDAFLVDMALEPPESGREEQGGAVTLSTVHSAKGLEWRIVFIISLCEGRFPAMPKGGDEAEMEEERRLFYVATTRVMDQLFLVVPESVSVPGGRAVLAEASRFFKEIPPDLLSVWAGNRRRAAVGASRPDTAAGGVGGSFPPGTRVRHPIFGPGVVRSVLGSDKVRVDFDVGGIKTLHLGFAKLSRI